MVSFGRVNIENLQAAVDKAYSRLEKHKSENSTLNEQGFISIISIFELIPAENTHAMIQLIDKSNNISESDIDYQKSIKQGISEFFLSVLQTAKAKDIVLEYISFLKQVVNGYLDAAYPITYFQNEYKQQIAKYREEFPMSQLAFEEIKDELYDIIHDDVFCSLFCYLALAIHSEQIILHFSEIGHSYISYLDYVKQNFRSLLNKLDENLPRTVLLKGLLLNDFYKSDPTELQFDYSIENYHTYPPISMPQIAFRDFLWVVKTELFQQVLGQFVRDYIGERKCPFDTVEKGVERYYQAVNYLESGNVVYHALLPKAHGMCSCGFVYIKSEYCMYSSILNRLIILITLIHETAHLYKKIDHGKPCPGHSPPSNINYKSGIQHVAEDGHRIETILFGVIDEKIYKSTALFMLNPSAWTLELSSFQKSIQELQREASKKTGEQFIAMKESGIEWPTLRCPRYNQGYWCA